jgi:type II restriction enzyme
MAHSEQLRQQRKGMVINRTARKQESRMRKALEVVIDRLKGSHNIPFNHISQWKSVDIIDRAQKHLPNTRLTCHSDRSAIRPDGGILCIEDVDGNTYPILISEAKTQGTNHLLEAAGKKRQALGNAIERLGKNTNAIEVAMIGEDINPFVCFGDGCDFADDLTILDRVHAIAGFVGINNIRLFDDGPFNRGSFFFREEPWSQTEMEDVMYKIASDSIKYYQTKYGESTF